MQLNRRYKSKVQSQFTLEAERHLIRSVVINRRYEVPALAARAERLVRFRAGYSRRFAS